MKELMRVLAVCVLGALAALPAHAKPPLRVQISEPYIDLRTGPGRGYPIFHVFERGDWVEVLQQRAGWVQLRGGRGVVGWTARDEIAGTVDDSGAQIAFRDPGRADYLNRRYEFSVVAGTLGGDTAIGIRLGYQFNELLGAELGYTHVPGTFSSTRALTLNITGSPLPHWRVEPTLTGGAGYFENVARPTLVDGDTTSDWAGNLGVGLRGYIGRNLVLRADLRRHTVFIEDNRQHFTEATAGVAVFF